MPTLTVTLTPTGNPNEYTLVMPAGLDGRLRHLRASEAQLEATLADRELGIADDTGNLVMRIGASVKKWAPLP